MRQAETMESSLLDVAFRELDVCRYDINTLLA